VTEMNRRSTRQAYRTDEQALPFLVMAGLFLVVAVFFLVIYAQDPGSPGVLAFVAVPSVVSACFFRCAFAAAVVDKTGVKIRNPWRTSEFSWAEVDHFSVERRGFTWGVGVAHLRDGRAVKIWAIQKPNAMTRPNNDAAEGLIENLNRRLQRATEARPEHVEETPARG
jgi:hypothetical protein